MLSLLAQAVPARELFIDRRRVLLPQPRGSPVTHSRLGFGPRKAKNRGLDVASQASVLRHDDTGWVFVAVWQNRECDNAAAFPPIAATVNQAIATFLSDPFGEGFVSRLGLRAILSRTGATTWHPAPRGAQRRRSR